MEIKTDDEYQRQKLQVVQEKTEQIQTVLADLFNAAVEEKESLDITLEPINSAQLIELIKSSDYQDMINIREIPNCILQADLLRLAQVIDNIVSNSYKYAETAIDVSAYVNANGLAVIFRDYGPGVRPNELPLVYSKYFRGKNVKDKNGYGLGLYLAQILMKAMGGELTCFNATPGFAVEVCLKFGNNRTPLP
jgi:K+-sensing histidine kinase KdpD